MTDLEIQIYNSLSTRSKRSLLKTKYAVGKKFGQAKPYHPRHDLLNRLAGELNLPKQEIYNRLLSIRRELLKD